MIGRKLLRLKKAEEKRILKEHEGLYETLVRENYPREEGKKREEKASFIKKLPFAVIGSVAAAAFVFAVAIGLTRFNGIGMNKGAAPGANINEGQNYIKPAGDEAFERQGYLSPAMLASLNASLEKSSLDIGTLKIRSVTEKKTGGETEYYRVEADTVPGYSVFDIIVGVGKDFSFEEELLPWENAEKDTEGPFDITYSVVRKRRGDMYSFMTKAKVDTGAEIYYITYNYVSEDPECELIDLIYYYIKPVE
ncbi:MAG: hypothetical protein IJU84_07170 [Clostridia bacterium]|nr:hypothetical protein [Clostridia bacterium]MBQ9481926.1 hypothetical protein [Clostridia bacterium]